MNKKLPSVYKNTNCNYINNNKTVFYCDDRTDERIVEKTSTNIENEYILNTPVIIETYTEKINAKIVSKIKDHIMTSNNKIIKLKDIKSIDLIK